MKRAIAYVSDWVASHRGEAFNRSRQIEIINKFASEHQIEIVAWFDDEPGAGQILVRPGIQALMAFEEPYDLVLCERVWALAHSMKDLEPFLAALDRRGAEFDCATSMWDLVSQQCRRRRSRDLPFMPARIQKAAEAEPARSVRVAKPARLNFEHLVHPAPSSMNLGF